MKVLQGNQCDLDHGLVQKGYELSMSPGHSPSGCASGLDSTMVAVRAADCEDKDRVRVESIDHAVFLR